jgi:hypothetical protein
LIVTTVPPDEVLYSTVDNQVRAAPNAASLFVASHELRVGYWQYGLTTEIAGPAGLKEEAFLAELRASHIGYREVRAGVLTAVIPDRSVRP